MRGPGRKVARLAKAAVFGAAVFGAGWLAAGLPDRFAVVRGYSPLLMTAGGLVFVAAVVALWNRATGSSGLIGWWSARSRRNGGTAGTWTMLRVSSRWAVRWRAKVLRPSLRAARFWRRWIAATREFATPIVKVGRQWVWSSVESVTLRVGGPRSGKTAELVGRIMDAPGAVIATSTRTDIVSLTSAARAANRRHAVGVSRLGNLAWVLGFVAVVMLFSGTPIGPLVWWHAAVAGLVCTGITVFLLTLDARRPVRPVVVFNPSGLGDLASTVTFDPLSGCGDPRTAMDRAEDLLASTAAPGGTDASFWADQARSKLAALLHAAALGQGSMRDVLAWVANPQASGPEIQQCLMRSSEPSLVDEAVQFSNMADRTRASVCATIMPALGWLSDANATAAASPGGSFDVAELLATGTTVYLLGAEDGRTAPLVTALTGHIAREARRLAALSDGGRLDPPLTLALDEAALICQVPLDRWTADMGGRNITVHLAFQGRAQIQQRWGHEGASTILNNTSALLVYGGMKDTDDLELFSKLAGDRYEEVVTRDDDGETRSITPHKVPVLSPGQISHLPAGKALVISRGMPAVIGRTERGWKRADIRAVAKAARWAELRARINTGVAGLGTRTVEAREVIAPRVSAARDRLGLRRSGRGRAPASFDRVHHQQHHDQHTERAEEQATTGGTEERR